MKHIADLESGFDFTSGKISSGNALEIRTRFHKISARTITLEKKKKVSSGCPCECPGGVWANFDFFYMIAIQCKV